MGKSNIGVFLFLLICSGFLFTFSQLGPFAYEQVFGEPRTYEPGTMVGPVQIGELTKSEARQKIASRATEWRETHNVTLEMKDHNIVFQKDFIEFDIPATLNQVTDGKKNFFIVEMNEVYFGSLKDKVSDQIYEHILIEDLSEKVMARAKALSNVPLTFSIYQYIGDGATELYEVVSEYSVEVNADMDGIGVMNELNGALIRNQTPFSLLSFVKEDMSQPSLNAVATTLYGAVLNTNFIINQRHISTKLPDYAELGKEASVKPDRNHDLVFTNPNEQSYQLETSVENGELVVRILGYPLPNTYELSLEDKRTIEPRTIVHLSEFVPVGQPNVKVEGKSGTSVEVYRFVEDDGKTLRKDFISDDYYPPVNRVEVRYGTDEEQDLGNNSDPSNTGASSNSGESVDTPPSGGNNNEAGEDPQSSDPNRSTSQGKEQDSQTDMDGGSDSERSNEDVEPEDIWEKPQGNTKSEDK